MDATGSSTTDKQSLSKQSSVASQALSSSSICSNPWSVSEDEQTLNQDDTATAQNSSETDCDSSGELNKSTDDIKLAEQDKLRELTTSDVKILQDSKPRELNGILKKQSSFSENSLSSIHEESNGTRPTSTTMIKKYRRLQSSHSLPLLSLTHNTTKSQEHRLLKKTSSVSFKLTK